MTNVDMLEVFLMVGFGVPIVVLSGAFLVCASYLQMKESRCHEGK